MLEVQHRMGVQHFAPLPFLLLFLTMLVCAAVGVFGGVWRIVRGPHRRRGVVLSAAALIPFVFWTSIGIYASSSWSHRQKPNTFPMQVARRGAASIMDAELYLRYPHRIERSRFTMFYQNLTSPAKDADEMEAYLTELEQRCHHSIRVPIFWVRGSLLGQSDMSDYGLALGSVDSATPVTSKGRTFDALSELDRHEMAHAVMHQWQHPGSDPPTFIEEGWAEANGNLRMNLASAAAQLTRLEKEQQTPRRGTMFVSLLNKDNYYRDEGAVYPCGGYITIYLIQKYGFDKFLELYTSVHVQTAAADIERVFGTHLATLEKQMWVEADRLNSANSSP